MDAQACTSLRIPAKAGVYLFKKGREILYVGKATSLKSRVRSYFDPRLVDTRGSHLVQMVAEADALEWDTTASVLEALILEAKLIKKFLPRYNTLSKDDKSFLYVTITHDSYPQVLLERGYGTYGPFTSASSIREALRIIRRIFPFSTHPPQKIAPFRKVQPSGTRPCFEYQIGLCPGTCVGAVEQREYRKTINKIRLLFEGKKARVLATLKKEMLMASKAQEFEKAAHCKQQIDALTHIRDISLIKDESGDLRRGSGYRIEGYDIAHHRGASTVGGMTVVEDGQVAKQWYRKFTVKSTLPGTVHDIEHLREVLRRRLVHLEWPLPQMIVVDGGLPQKQAAESLLAEKGFAITVAAVLKDDRHKPKEILVEKKYALKYGKDILLVNGEAHRFAVTFHRKVARKQLLR